jgi:uncharacterized membrane protein
VGTNRLEAFSDGVIAVAATLLVLDLAVPLIGTHSTSTLAHELGVKWPTYVAYIVSFLTIGIIWINHHAMIGRLREADHSILILNLFLLMSIVVLPWTTRLMSTYLRLPHGEHLAAAMYGASFLVMSLLFSWLNFHILFRRSHLLADELSSEHRRAILTRGVVGNVPYLIATALAPLSPYLTFAICAAIAGFYALPIASGGDLPA